MTAARPTLAAADDVAALLREGGVVIALRHAQASGTFDPPDFKPGVCSTQRNLSDDARVVRRYRRAFDIVVQDLHLPRVEVALDQVALPPVPNVA